MNNYRITVLLLAVFISGLFSTENELNIFAGGPLLQVSPDNNETQGLYDRFEIIVDFRNVQYSNSYNPEEMDLRGVFISPCGNHY